MMADLPASILLAHQILSFGEIVGIAPFSVATL
jgi:hypothetical protein